MTGTISPESILISVESNWIQVFSLHMTMVTRIPPEQLAMIMTRAASMLRRVNCSAGFTVVGGDWVGLSRGLVVGASGADQGGVFLARLV